MSDEEKFGKLEPLEMKEVWPHEAREFTPWLRDNISVLSDALELKLYARNTEVKVGNFVLDLLAEDENGSTVVIENQFTSTNHDHLGKLLTYASGCDANILIWVTGDVRDEHRMAMEWLNRRTDTEMEFYLVKVEIFKIDNSLRAYKFIPIVISNKWQKKLQKSLVVKTAKDMIRDEYFNQFRKDLKEANFPLQQCDYKNFPPCRLFYVGVRGWVIGHEIAGKYAEVYLWFKDESKENVSMLRKKLLKQKKSLTNKIKGFECERWKVVACVGVARVSSFSEGEDALNEIRKWAVENILKFAEIFSKEMLEEVAKALGESEKKIED